ncbi:MAG TPA: hypothetical protein VM123_08540 [archaeon]|nr:hypothetical protein [archaeon]
MQFFPLLALFFLIGCATPEAPRNILSPADEENQPIPSGDLETTTELALDLSLTVKPGEASPLPVLASARDDTTSDSLNLYIDVAIGNISPEVVVLPSETKDLSLAAQVSFVDVPYKKNFLHGKIKLVVGWTETGLQASEVYEYEFATDSTLLVSIPLSRVDSFHIADNVAVYGNVLSAGRYMIAKTVRRLESPTLPETLPKPDLVGFVRSVDIQNNRLYVSNATVVITDSTRIESPSGGLIHLGMLEPGCNELTITALAWAYSLDIGVIANGWEFRRFDVIVAQEISP